MPLYKKHLIKIVIALTLILVAGVSFELSRPSQSRANMAPRVGIDPYGRARNLVSVVLSNTYTKAGGIYVGRWDDKRHSLEKWYGKNDSTQYNAASLTKMATALVVLSTNRMTTSVIPDLKQQIPLTRDIPRIRTTVGALLEALMVHSSNTAAYILAQHTSGRVALFVDKMNVLASDLGLHDSIFRDPSGYDFGSKQQASYMSPRDAVRIAVELYKQHPTVAIMSTEEEAEFPLKRGGTLSLGNTNKIIGGVVNARLSKTGYTSLAGGNLVMLFEPEPGVLVGAAIMGSTVAGRFSDMNTVWNVVHNAVVTSYALAENRLTN